LGLQAGRGEAENTLEKQDIWEDYGPKKVRQGLKSHTTGEAKHDDLE
jgi:hypothetical protein